MAGHEHLITSVRDDDNPFVIDPVTRKISLPSNAERLVIIQNDHNSEQFTFSIDTTVETHDMSQCNRIQVHYINIDASNPAVYNSDMDEILESDIVNEDGVLKIAWTISGNATQYIGPLNFALRFLCVKEIADEETGELENRTVYAWGTSPCKGVTVSEGMYNVDEASDHYWEIVDAWEKRIREVGEVVKADVETATSDAVGAVQNSASSAIKSVEDSGTTTTSTVKADIRLFKEEVKENIAYDFMTDNGILVQETGHNSNKIMSQDSVTKELEAVVTETNAKYDESISNTNSRCTEIEESLISKMKSNSIPTHTGSLKDGVTYKMVHGLGLEPYDDGWRTHFALNYSISYSSDRADTNWNDLTLPFPESESKATSGLAFENSSDYKGYTFRILGLGLEFLPVTAGSTTTITMQPVVRYEFNSKYYKTYPVDSNGIVPFVALDNEDEYEYFSSTLRIVSKTDGDWDLYEMSDVPTTLVKELKIDPTSITEISGPSTSGLVDTYTTHLSDGTTKIITVTNGRGIESVERTYMGEYEDTYTIMFNDGTASEFKIATQRGAVLGMKTHLSGESIHADDVSAVEHVLDIKARSKNLFELDYNVNIIENGVTYLYDERGEQGAMQVTGSVPDGISKCVLTPYNDIVLVDGETYYIGESDHFYVSYRDQNGALIIHSNGSLTWSSKYELQEIYLQYSVDDGEINEVVRPMICIGNKPETFIPYTTPQTITVCGKNLLNPAVMPESNTNNGITVTREGDAITLNGTATADSVLFNCNNILLPGPDGTYSMWDRWSRYYVLSYEYISGNVNGLGSHTLCMGKAETATASREGWLTVTLKNNSDSQSMVLDKAWIKDMWFYVSAGTVFDNYKIKVQLARSSEATKVEPYIGKNYLLYSNGIPVEQVTSLYPITNIFSTTSIIGKLAHIDVTYSKDLAITYSRLLERVESLLNGGT